ncbi:MAG: glutaredoxin domain-containing protein [Bacteroidales bacterium]|jgi:glutaredoxin-like YruB-family protein|nr:glutaredoxin domain-containing protein [Bacteroidales bacterium]
MKFKEIESYQALLQELPKRNTSYLLIYKSGAEQSECALANIKRVEAKASEIQLLVVDVTKTRDIHSHYNVTTAPVLIEFSGEKPGKQIKGCHEPVFFKSLFENVLYSSPQNAGDRKFKRVVVYSTPTCPHCNTLKNYLKKLKIPFRDIDVSRDQKMAQEMVKRSGQQGVPQVDINGRLIVGFNKPKIDELLEVK